MRPGRAERCIANPIAPCTGQSWLFVPPLDQPLELQIRLQKSRLPLLTGTDDVATLGYRVGYDSTSQFSREYRRQFGLPPGRDADRLRARAGTA